MAKTKKVITPEAILSFPNLDKPVVPANGKGEPKYSVALIFPAKSNLQEIDAAVMEVAEEKWGAKAKQMLKTGQLEVALRSDAEAKGYPEGARFFNARSKERPGLVHPYKDEATGKPALVTEDEIKKVFYPGAKVRASVTVFAYEYTEEGRVMKRGVSFGLNNLQKLGDGPRLDGRKKADDEFEATQELAPADLADVGA